MRNQHSFIYIISLLHTLSQKTNILLSSLLPKHTHYILFSLFPHRKYACTSTSTWKITFRLIPKLRNFGVSVIQSPIIRCFEKDPESSRSSLALLWSKSDYITVPCFLRFLNRNRFTVNFNFLHKAIKFHKQNNIFDVSRLTPNIYIQITCINVHLPLSLLSQFSK